MSTDLKKGIVYVATGADYVEEAIIAATSCKRHNNYPIALITDRNPPELPEGLFNVVIKKDAAYTYKDKLMLKYSPFESSIFLDTDTYVAENLDDLFKLLEFREFAIHQADEGYEFQMDEVSNAMPEFNTGVIAFRQTPAVKKLLDDWENAFLANPGIKTDQYHLRKTLYASDVRFAIFSSAYNFIIYYPNFVIQTVKVVHGRPLHLLPEIAKDINMIRHTDAWRRAFYPYNNRHGILYQNLQSKDIYKLMGFHFRALAGNWYRKVKMFAGNLKSRISRKQNAEND
ncbi:MAG: putative nucleotide-diphospho-sugar transferase [Bacteroidota bacterium]